MTENTNTQTPSLQESPQIQRNVSSPTANTNTASTPKGMGMRSKNFSLQMILGAIGMVILLIGGGVGLYLSRQSQDVRQQASVGGSGTVCCQTASDGLRWTTSNEECTSGFEGTVMPSNICAVDECDRTTGRPLGCTCTGPSQCNSGRCAPEDGTLKCVPNDACTADSGRPNDCGCNSNGQCSSGYCNPTNAKCTAPPENPCDVSINKPLGCECGRHQDCNSAYCSPDAVCAPKPDACQKATDRPADCPCENDGQCRQNNCTKTGPGTPTTCQRADYIDPCERTSGRPNNCACQSNNNVCESNYCQPVSDKCKPNPICTTAPDGELPLGCPCGDGGNAACATNECKPNANGTRVCITPVVCNGQSYLTCRNKAPGTQCTPQGGGDGRCTGTAGEACLCIKGPIGACSPLGQQCGDNTPCCAKTDDGKDMVCSVGICKTVDTVCQTQAECQKFGDTCVPMQYNSSCWVPVGPSTCVAGTTPTADGKCKCANGAVVGVATSCPAVCQTKPQCEQTGDTCIQNSYGCWVIDPTKVTCLSEGKACSESPTATALCCSGLNCDLGRCVRNSTSTTITCWNSACQSTTVTGTNPTCGGAYPLTSRPSTCGGGACVGAGSSCEASACCDGTVCQGTVGDRICQVQQVGECGSNSTCGGDGGWFGFQCTSLTDGQCLENKQTFNKYEDAYKYAAQYGCGQVDEVCVGGTTKPGQLCGDFNIIDTNCGIVNPSGSPVATPNGPVCVSITANVIEPKVGDKIKFTCGNVIGATDYRFRIKLPNGTVQTLQNQTDNIHKSETFTLSQPGRHYAQCRPCISGKCAEWENLPQ